MCIPESHVFTGRCIYSNQRALNGDSGGEGKERERGKNEIKYQEGIICAYSVSHNPCPPTNKVTDGPRFNGTPCNMLAPTESLTKLSLVNTTLRIQERSPVPRKLHQDTQYTSDRLGEQVKGNTGCNKKMCFFSYFVPESDPGSRQLCLENFRSIL